jgi:DNA repair exonuclease SbcCD ATPase subunit
MSLVQPLKFRKVTMLSELSLMPGMLRMVREIRLMKSMDALGIDVDKTLRYFRMFLDEIEQREEHVAELEADRAALLARLEYQQKLFEEKLKEMNEHHRFEIETALKAHRETKARLERAEAVVVEVLASLRRSGRCPVCWLAMKGGQYRHANNCPVAAYQEASDER